MRDGILVVVVIEVRLRDDVAGPFAGFAKNSPHILAENSEHEQLQRPDQRYDEGDGCPAGHHPAKRQCLSGKKLNPMNHL